MITTSTSAQMVPKMTLNPGVPKNSRSRPSPDSIPGIAPDDQMIQSRMSRPCAASRDAHHLEQFYRTPFRRFEVHPEMQLKRLGQLAPNAEHWVERGHGLLEHHGDLVAPDGPYLGVSQLAQI